MKINLKPIVLTFIFSVISLVSVMEVSAVPYPERIQWRASPYNFAVSLYRGVLGRNPESVAVAQAWAGNVTSNPNSRLTTFFRMLRESEYVNGAYGSQRKRYRVYVGRSGNRKQYTTFAGDNRNSYWVPVYNRYFNQGEGRAIVFFYQTYYSRR